MPGNRVVVLRDKVGVIARWVLLVGLALLPAMRAPVGVSASIPLMFGIAWNLGLSFLALTERRIGFQGVLTIAMDALIGLALFYNAGTVLGPWAWAGLLPIFSAALLLGSVGGTVAALSATIVFALLALVDVPLVLMPGYMLAPTLYFLVTGVVVGYAVDRLLVEKREEMVDTPSNPSPAWDGDGRVKALAEIALILSGSMLYDQILDLALDVSEKMLLSPNEVVSRLVGAVLIFHEEGLQMAASRRLAAGDLGRSLPGRSGILKEVIESGEAKILKGPGTDPELIRLAAFQSCTAVYCIPLRAGLDLYGLMLFGHIEPDFFSPQRLELLNVVGNQVMVSLQNAQLYETVNEEKQRIVEIQDQAQTQLARNLHDGPTQSVAAIAMRVNLVRRLIKDNSGSAEGELLKVEELARRTTKEMRHMLFSLQPKSLENGGLAMALEDLVKQTQDTFEQAVDLRANGEAVKKMDLGRQGVLFHIAAEAITNARKHAGASRIAVRLDLAEEDIVLLEIIDDGAGFDQKEVEGMRKQGGKLGLATLRERVELINGVLSIESEQGRGTRVRVWAPLNEQAAERLRYGAQT